MTQEGHYTRINSLECCGYRHKHEVKTCCSYIIQQNIKIAHSAKEIYVTEQNE